MTLATQYRIADTWAPLNEIPYATHRDLSNADSYRTWTKSIQFKTSIRVLGNHHIVTGKIPGSYFGFRISNSNLKAIYNAGNDNGEILSANLATLNMLDNYRLEVISNVDNGTISYYLDDKLIHVFSENTTDWDDNESSRLWMIDSPHGVVKFRQS